MKIKFFYFTMLIFAAVGFAATTLWEIELICNGTFSKLIHNINYENLGVMMLFMFVWFIPAFLCEYWTIKLMTGKKCSEKVS